MTTILSKENGTKTNNFQKQRLCKRQNLTLMVFDRFDLQTYRLTTLPNVFFVLKNATKQEMLKKNFDINKKNIFIRGLEMQTLRA